MFYKFIYRNASKSLLFPNVPFLVSYPRTGSHWLRLIIEKYTDRPSAPRPLAVKNILKIRAPSVWHVHDVDLCFRSKISRGFYLFRNPVETIASNLAYYSFDKMNEAYLRYAIKYLASKYNRHMLHYNSCVMDQSLLPVIYEDLVIKNTDLLNAIVVHLGFYLDVMPDFEKLRFLVSSLGKKETKSFTQYNRKAVNLIDSQKAYPSLDRIENILLGFKEDQCFRTYENLADASRTLWRL